MFNASELQFLRKAFAKCRINVSLCKPNDKLSDVANDIFKQIIADNASKLTVSDFIVEILPHTLYKITNRFSLCFNYCECQADGEMSILIIGPYLSSPLSSSDILEICEKNGIFIGAHKYASEFYAGIPVLQQDDRLFIFLSTFCEHLWDIESFSIVDLTEKNDSALFPISGDSDRRDDFDSTLINMKLIEKRYEFENMLINAVTEGQLHKETELMNSILESHFEKRVSDSVRNAKNYSIIMNTLLRKAAEKGGVHPMYIDKMSSDFASKIEAVTSLAGNLDLMLEMFRSYCKLVRKYSMQGLSPIVRKTVLMIDADLSADLSLSSLSEAQSVSSGYLATIFKKELGKTVSEFIREKRVKRAKTLLSTTNLQVQTIAVHCGIMDVQYFTKIFKKTTGMTPKQYRENNQNIQKI
jgi:AraC-like DNA-binding protein